MYRPHRSVLFEYATDAIEYVEELQCSTCKYKDPVLDVSIMCDAQLDILLEHDIDFMDEREDGTIVCNRWEQE